MKSSTPRERLGASLTAARTTSARAARAGRQRRVGDHGVSRGLLRALAGVWEAVEPAGMTGGHLRGLFADGLDEAAAVLDEPALTAEAQRWREIADRWHALADTALPDDVPAIARLRGLTATITGAVAEGDAGAGERAAAAEELWVLRAEHADAPPLSEDEVNDVLAARAHRRGRPPTR